LEGFDVFDANEENSVKENKRGGQKKTEDAKNVDTYKTGIRFLNRNRSKIFFEHTGHP